MNKTCSKAPGQNMHFCIIIVIPLWILKFYLQLAFCFKSKPTILFSSWRCQQNSNFFLQRQSLLQINKDKGRKHGRITLPYRKESLMKPLGRQIIKIKDNHIYNFMIQEVDNFFKIYLADIWQNTRKSTQSRELKIPCKIHLPYLWVPYESSTPLVHKMSNMSQEEPEIIKTC